MNDRTLYSPRLQKIPAPRFVVFYNGTQEKEDISELRLSDAFEGSGEADLELKVKMVNINEGHNQGLMKQCRILWEYARYVAKVRGYTREGFNLDEAVELAVDECIKEGVLAKFLSENRAEVISVSIFEYDKEEEEKKLRKEEFALGEESGIKKGEKKGREEGRKEGLEEGHEKGAQQMAVLCQRLLEDNRVDDLKRCTEDAEYRKALMMEYGVIETAPVA